MRNLVQGTISDMLTSVSHHREPVLMVKGNLDCERPLEGAVDEGRREEEHQPTHETFCCSLPATDVPDLGFVGCSLPERNTHKAGPGQVERMQRPWLFQECSPTEIPPTPLEERENSSVSLVKTETSGRFLTKLLLFLE